MSVIFLPKIVEMVMSESLTPKPAPVSKRALCWVRRDMRLDDHAALSYATTHAEEVIIVFVFDSEILKHLQDRDDRRITFIRESLDEMDHRCRDRGSAVLVRVGDPTVEIPALVAALECDLLIAGRDYEPYAVQRDGKVYREAKKLGCEFLTVKDSVILEKGEVLSLQEKPFRVFSPYARAWRKAFRTSIDAAEYESDLSKLVDEKIIRPHVHDWSYAALGFEPSELWLKPGSAEAQRRLADFVPKMSKYDGARNFPAISGTSTLSPYLRFGNISIRAAVRAALQSGSDGADKWLSELIWRDFYQDILAHNPHVATETFDPTYRKIQYPGEDSHFQAWCEGQTGYPIIDAAMRCFNATGWMHNRLRMVVASFLTKDLLVDYRKGETYFARYLLDFDLASNNGGWQWAASTGCDPQPYFRIFNPILQSEKFDAEAKFIREWIPEIAGLSNKGIHAPWRLNPFELIAAGVELGKQYPHPIVEHDKMRPQAIELLASARKAKENV